MYFSVDTLSQYIELTTGARSYVNYLLGLIKLSGKRVWNAKLTETQIFREFSIELESSLFNYRALYFNY